MDPRHDPGQYRLYAEDDEEDPECRKKKEVTLAVGRKKESTNSGFGSAPESLVSFSADLGKDLSTKRVRREIETTVRW